MKTPCQSAYLRLACLIYMRFSGRHVTTASLRLPLLVRMSVLFLLQHAVNSARRQRTLPVGVKSTVESSVLKRLLLLQSSFLGSVGSDEPCKSSFSTGDFQGVYILLRNMTDLAISFSVIQS